MYDLVKMFLEPAAQLLCIDSPYLFRYNLRIPCFKLQGESLFGHGIDITGWSQACRTLTVFLLCDWSQAYRTLIVFLL
jgi:hypothetical protein